MRKFALLCLCELLFYAKLFNGLAEDNIFFYKSSHKTFIGTYLVENGLEYSTETAHLWLKLRQYPEGSRQMYAKALQRLDDVYAYGAIRFIHQMRMPLCQELDEMMQAYLHSISGKYSVSHLANIETRCRYFLGFLQQQQGITAFRDISYPDILAFCRDPLESLCKADRCMYKGSTMRFLEWLSEKQLCPSGFAMLLFQGRCRPALTAFLELKRREEKADSTICMYRSANVRFCWFLAAQGITRFSDITPEVLKKFNMEDKHRTSEGKNAYNVRIRKFIFYLAAQGFVGGPFLAYALPCVSASKVRVVEILSEEETKELESYSDPDEPSLGLRDRAILLIGLKMGMRASDITALRLEQIDWVNASIRFIQDKTDVEKILPMPVEVGNALYTYLCHGRPAGRSPYVFITHKAPYRKIGRSVCRHILKKALPERNVPGSGFHVARKTFATKLYLSLDEERMRMCPVSLESAGIPLEGGLRNE